MAISTKALRKRHLQLRAAVDEYRSRYSQDTPYLHGTLNGLIVALSIMDDVRPDLVDEDKVKTNAD